MNFTATIKSSAQIAQSMFRITVGGVPSEVFESFAPGRFAHLRIPNAPDLLLRRPLAIYDLRPELCELDFAYRVCGEGTRRLIFAQAGDKIDILAPLGTGFSVPEGLKTGAVVGGGSGCAALLAVAKGFPNIAWSAYLGFADKAQAYGVERFEEEYGHVEVFTDDGSLGAAGNPTAALCGASKLPDVVFACGPDPMLRALQKGLPKSVHAQASLEERMGCGVGACLVCACKALGALGETKHRRVCVDGPVFGLWEVMLNG